MEHKILVAYASNAGSTADVARTIGEELALTGATVDVRPIRDLEDAGLGGYTAIIVGAPMILGWHRDAGRFVAKNRAALSKVPVAFFVTAMSLTATDEAPPAGASVYVDPKLPKPPRKPGRLSLKERYATLGNYLRPVLGSAKGFKPVSIALFGGRLDFRRLKFLQMFFVMLILAAQPGDHRNWDAIRAWARELPAKFTLA